MRGTFMDQGGLFSFISAEARVPRSHAMMENRNGLAIAGLVTLAYGKAERRASERMLKAKSKQAPGRVA